MHKPVSFYLTPVEIRLSEADGGVTVPKRVQVLRTGTFFDPRYQKFSVTKDTLATLKKNFDQGVRRIDIAVDYFHEKEKIAAGWFKALELSDDGEELWAEVEWTPRAEKTLAEKELRYISPNFDPDYRDNETLQKHGPTLLGAGLTNRPVIKGMAPATELSEGDIMTPEQIKELQDKLAASEARCQELESQVKTLSEKVGASEKAMALAERTTKFEKMLSEGKAVPAQKEAFLAGDMDKFLELAEPMKTKEIGHGGEVKPAPKAAESKTPAQDKVLELAEKKVTEKKIEMADAIGLVLAEDATLNAAYEKEISQ